MYCPRCGARNQDNTLTCAACDVALGQPMGTTQYQPRPYVPNNLVWAILATLFCCLPLGIPAIVSASQVDSKVAAGDITGAQIASDSARKWCWGSFGVGLAGIIIYTVIIAAGAALGGTR